MKLILQIWGLLTLFAIIVPLAINFLMEAFTYYNLPALVVGSFFTLVWVAVLGLIVHLLAVNDEK